MSAPRISRPEAPTESSTLERKELIATSAATPSVIEPMYSPTRRHDARVSRAALFDPGLVRRAGAVAAGGVLHDAPARQPQHPPRARRQLRVVRHQHQR